MLSSAQNADLPLRPFIVPGLKLDVGASLEHSHPAEKLMPTHKALPLLRVASVAEGELPAPAAFVRRRASLVQGRALESLGHAVEYLVDSRMFLLGEHNRAAEGEAVKILMKLSRLVFSECPEVISPWTKLERCVVECRSRWLGW